MNPFRSNVGTLNEILFENKNKSYGAYAIRTAYESTVLKSLGITASIMLGGTWFLSVLLGKEVETKIPIVDDLITTVTHTITLDNLDKPKDQPKVKKVEPKSAAAAVKNNAAHFVIKDKPVDSANIKLIDPINGVGTSSVVNTNTASIVDSNPGTNSVATGGGGTGAAPSQYYDEAPECPGGLKNFWVANLKYPNVAREYGIEGKVCVNFVLDEEGNLTSATIIKKLGYGCDEEVLRVAKMMPKWKPAKIAGKPIKVTFNQMVDFKLK